ncbi:MAG: hypothetical protein ACR2LF_10485 [Jatrophihabitantaceae bacterium]
MNRRNRARALIAAGALLLTGCASSRAATQPPAAAPAGAMTPGMVMPDGSTMGAVAASPSAGAAFAGSPSSAEKMICAAETHADITKVLGLKQSPPATSSWVQHLYTCTYRLPMGTFVVSVKQSSDPSTAKAYFAHLRTTLGSTQTLDGLGQGSYGTTAGTVVLIKDSDTLTVDATRLPAVFGAQQSKRFDFAYEIASDILGCWTGG